MTYYNMTGSEGAILQARISSFSESIGGIAYTANAVLHEAFRDAPEGEGQYQGIYYLSQKVSEKALEAIESSIEETDSSNSDAGYITDLEMFQSAQQAWSDAGQEDQFPGDELLDVANWANQAFGLVNFDLASIDAVEALNSLVDVVQNASATDFSTLYDALFTDPSVVASLVSVFGADIFGKRLSDYEGREGYRLVNTPDGEYVSVIGDAGDDLLRGGADDDHLEGGEGNDILDGGDITPNDSGNDTLIGGADDNVLLGGDGDDHLYGDAENIAHSNVTGNDELYGGDGNDSLYAR